MAIRLINEDGKIVGKDTETGDTVPIELDSELQAPAIQTGELNDGGPLSDGDGTERQVWVIGNGDSDPSDASDDDIIFEEGE